jgi:hypothetical protein
MEYGPGKTGGIEHSNEHSKHMIQINKKVRFQRKQSLPLVDLLLRAPGEFHRLPIRLAAGSTKTLSNWKGRKEVT